MHFSFPVITFLSGRNLNHEMPMHREYMNRTTRIKHDASRLVVVITIPSFPPFQLAYGKSMQGTLRVLTTYTLIYI